MRKKIIYISTNDGSDTRINKEIKSLSKVFDIIFLGVGAYGKNNFVEKYCSEFYLIQGKRNTLFTALKHVLFYLKLLITKKIHSVHIINEQLMIFFYPFLFHKFVVLDIFDSIFMKIGKTKNKWSIQKRIVYLPINYIFVTDINRRKLMPDFLLGKVGVLENYPMLYKYSTIKKSEGLVIFYFGTMNRSRGTEILNELITKYQDIKIIMAGWINDDITEKFSELKNVDFKGVITQNEASKIAATQADYIMCCYEPSNDNNINASPNKIYDAIQTKTPVIINREVKVSSFVQENEIGIVLDSYYTYNIDKLYNELKDKKGKFKFSENSSKLFSWEHIEDKLLKAHKFN